MRKLVVVLALMGMAIILAGCGDKKEKDNKAGGTPTVDGSTPVPTQTVRPPAPRSRPLPDGEPYAFEAPFSVGNFVRQHMDGRAVSAPTGGLQATYYDGVSSVVLTVYRFDQPEEAVKTVEFTLDSGSAVQDMVPLYSGPAVAYGVVQERQGGYLAAWSHYEWCFLVSTSGSLDVLNVFLDSFPY
jgi:hypothetical protein